MALAPFFDKTAVAAATILHGFDRSEFVNVLEKHVVGVVFDQSTRHVIEARHTAELVTNLIARLYPSIAIVALHKDNERFAMELRGLAKRINPQIDFLESASVTIAVVIGATPYDLANEVIYAGSDAWVAKISSTVPVKSGNSNVPFGAAAAACFAAANVFRVAFVESLQTSLRDNDIDLSVLTFRKPLTVEDNPPLPPVDLRGTVLVGAGAVGNAFLWALSRAVPVTGEIDVVDPECFEMSNAQRYVLTTPEDVELEKTAIAKREVATQASTTGVTIVPHPRRWGAFLAKRELPWRLKRVAVAVDSADDRCAVQAALPFWIANAWTQAGDLGVSRHSFTGSNACLACLYSPTTTQKNEDQIIAEAVHLPGELMLVRDLLFTGRPVGEALALRIGSLLGLPTEIASKFASHPLRAFYTDVVCGGIALRLGNASNTDTTEVPMAFQSAMAGVLLAATTVAHAAGLALPEETKTVMNLLQPLGTELSVPVAKQASERCICQDPDYRAFYAEQFR